MGFPNQFLDELRSRFRLSEVVGRRVKLTRRGHEFTGLCPFHHEKSPSFAVVEDKGFYHCFGCQAHGDLFKFVMETEGLGFPEAVERLAEEAGLPVPRASQQEREQAQARASLHDVLELAAQFFEQQLQSPQGAEARNYLQGRGISRETGAAFRIGYAPGNPGVLIGFMKGKGIEPSAMAEAGLLAQAAEDQGPRELFRNRVIIPICDPRGRVIAFGGRALLPEQKPKYLNSPDTALFHKGRVLFNLDKARRPAFAKREILVAEGYMDVIALTRAGFAHAVAPLGTALTEDQLAMLWQVAPEPLLCFDGDAAGIRAAHKAADRALPLIKPGHSLRFVFLSGGMDPDDLLRAEGPEGVQRALAQTVPLADVLWNREVLGQDLSTPERRAGLEARLAALAGAIADGAVRDHYRQDFRRRVQELFGFTQRKGERKPGSRGFSAGPRRFSAVTAFQPSGPDPSLAENPLARSARRGEKAPAGGFREELLLVALLNHPWLVDLHYEELEGLQLLAPALERMRLALLECACQGQSLDKTALYDHLAQRGLGEIALSVLNRPALKAVKFARADAAREIVTEGFREALAGHLKEAILREELRQARIAWAADPTVENTARMRDLELHLSSQRNPSSGRGALEEGYEAPGPR
ncbi:MAG: DNA primase [Alphaproteobacteria bacterium]|nr:DNA primase [Alphaproteobacteria bacterium]